MEVQILETEDSARRERPAMVTLRKLINLTSHVLVGVITSHILWMAYRTYKVPYSWHVILCTIGYVVFMVEALLVYNPQNLWSNQLKRNTSKTLHWILMACAFTCIITGVALQINMKEGRGTPHFITYHGKSGLSATILVILTVFGGITLKYSKHILPKVRLVILKCGHNVLGAVAFTFGMLTIILSFYSKWFNHNGSYPEQVFLIISTLFVTIVTLVRPFKNIFYRIKSL